MSVREERRGIAKQLCCKQYVSLHWLEAHHPQISIICGKLEAPLVAIHTPAHAPASSSIPFSSWVSVSSPIPYNAPKVLFSPSTVLDLYARRPSTRFDFWFFASLRPLNVRIAIPSGVLGWLWWDRNTWCQCRTQHQSNAGSINASPSLLFTDEPCI